MKAKKIGIVYVKGFIQNIASVEKVFNQVVNQLILEGRVVKASTQDSTLFEDGSKVTKIPFKSLIGHRFTHLYVDESVFELDSGHRYLNEMLIPTVIQGGNYQNIDAEGNPSERIFTFSLKNGVKPIDKSEK